MNKRIIGMLLIALFIMSFVASGSEYYLMPKDGNASVDDNVTEIEVWLNASVPVASGLVRVNYTYCCINITGYDANLTDFEDVATYIKDGQVNMAFAHWDASLPVNHPVGEYHLGNLVIECCGDNCQTNLSLVECELFDWYEYGPAGEIPFVVTNGTFTCNASDERDDEPCLGTCYSDPNCTEMIAENISCCECVGAEGYRWHPNLDTACFGVNVTPFDLCLDYCPECVNCMDDDGDNFTDYPLDPECLSGLDPSESEQMPPIPEAGTFILVMLGLGSVIVVCCIGAIREKLK